MFNRRLTSGVRHRSRRGIEQPKKEPLEAAQRFNREASNKVAAPLGQIQDRWMNTVNIRQA
jgi:hypothetical protein